MVLCRFALWALFKTKSIDVSLFFSAIRPVQGVRFYATRRVQFTCDSPCKARVEISTSRRLQIFFFAASPGALLDTGPILPINKRIIFTLPSQSVL